MHKLRSKKIGKTAWLISFFILSFGLLFFGCSEKYILADEEGRFLGGQKGLYPILSFFFDGVPDPDKVDLRAQGADKTTRKKGGGAPALRLTEHGPYAARECQACHERGTNALVLPIQELCLKCHSVGLGKKWIHGPIASGGCRVCHNPHSSPYPFLLVSGGTDFCFYCHAEKDIFKNQAHKDKAEKCSECHNPHASDKRLLLK